MTKATTTVTTVRDARTGRFVEVRGLGALKGKLTLRRGIDLTKPIFEQVVVKEPGEAPRTANR